MKLGFDCRHGAALLVLACSGGQTGDAGLGVDEGREPPTGPASPSSEPDGGAEIGRPALEDTAAPGRIELGDANNYRAMLSLQLPVVETQSAADLQVCWDELSADFACSGVTPASDVKSVALLRFPETSPTAVTAMLERGNLDVKQLASYMDVTTVPGDVCVSLSSMASFGQGIDLARDHVESDDSYLFWFTGSTTPGTQILSMLFIRPSSTSTNTTVEAPVACSGEERLMSVSADLDELVPLVVPQDGPFVVDWQTLTRPGLEEQLLEGIDGGQLSFHAGASLLDLEANLLDLEAAATRLWSFDAERSTSHDLARAQDHSTGESFQGFDRDDGLWVLALTCSSCWPRGLPPVVTVIRPE